ncbi:hypothetical protein [Chromobacterium subtsugae]|uniref:hypothetical protein n=1 Tax=Chromobacterium subtsugae TaxID=251747 RepID=UPI00128AFE41|nr:hypothetical protein [Chromobacterium subtsugae]
MSIFTSNGRNGKIITSTLPSGDYSIAGSGDEWFVEKARSIAKECGGVWGANNWVIPKARKSAAIARLMEQLE